MAFSWPLRVYIEDTDFGGIVYYVNYLKFMERARTELLRAAGWSQDAFRNRGYIFVVARANADYRAPARLDAELLINTSIAEQRGARVRFSQAVVKAQDASVLVSAEIEVICVDAQTLRPKRWPAELIESLKEKVPQAWQVQE